MSGRTPVRRRRKGAPEEEHANHERWLVSYADMITVLMALFIVLFAISQVDQDKYIALRDSLSSGFQDTTTSPSVLDGSDGNLDGTSTQTDNTPARGTAGMVNADNGLGQEASDPVVAKAVDAKPTPAAGVDPALLAAARAEAAHLAALQAQIEASLANNGLANMVRYRIDSRGLTLGLVANDVFFAQGSAVMTPTALRILDVAAPLMVGLNENISIEGHANVVPVSGRYPTNWELSSDRATQVLRHLVEADGMPGGRIMAVGYGDTRPLVPGASPDALASNRRVDIVILSSAPENVRALLPALTAKG
ncbi:flagellar motor protein MotB [Cellulomonas sp. URHD0024]|uniref:OmpA/MotB family protein n=1 Tax=Cellulomonas sp. URHD0024 TaxID=1302620 RepID=UPI00040ABAB4|nr:flagellar motor protein MotB [Cellulomonas sp. URHD0024]